MTASTASIQSRAMLAQLNIKIWSAQKLDKAATRKTTTDAQAVSDAARVNKRLLAGQDATLKAIATIASAARTDYYHLTSPWQDGSAILSVSLWKELQGKLEVYERDFAAAVRIFLDDYAQSRERAKFALGALFDDNDYPSPYKVESKFSFSFAFDSLPNAGDWRIELADADADMLRKDLETRANARFANAMRDVWQRLYDACEHIKTTLPAYDAGTAKRFNDTLIGNLQDLLRILPALNIAADPALTALADRAAADLATLDPQTLRDSPATRTRATNAAAEICRTMAQHLGIAAPSAAPISAPTPTHGPALVIDLFAPAIRTAA